MAVDSPRSMTLEEFEQQQANLRCVKCGAAALDASSPMDNGGIRVDCRNCGQRHALGRIIFLKQTTKKRRKDYPMGESLQEVWTRWGDMCFSCGRTFQECADQHICRHRHHVSEYAKVGHEGPIVPICGLCHPVVTSLQKMRALVQWAREHATESVPLSSAGVPSSGLSPDSMRPERQAPAGGVEGLSDDDADA